jgi:hypothetical protein
MIKSNLLLILAISCLITILLIISIKPLKIINIESLNGQWIGMYKNSNVILEMKKDKSCSLEFREISSSEVERFNGDCSIDKSKIPYSFIMTNIPEINTSLYSLIAPINQNIIHISEFSNKWKLRPITLTQENTIIFKRYIN